MSQTGFLDRATSDLNYVVYVPRGVEPKGLPVILFLHGHGESGTDGLRQTLIGLPHAIRATHYRWQFIVVSPQKPDFDALWSKYKEALNVMLADVEKEFHPDPHRRYITGLSQGGRGTFDLCTALDWHFAAAAPVCGWTEPEEAAKRLVHMPLWAFHGDEDQAVKFESGQQAVALLKDQGADATFTLYPGVGHNSWDKAYQESDLPTWFLAHTRA